MMKGGNMATNKAQSLGLSETISEEHVEEIINSKDYILNSLNSSCDRTTFCPSESSRKRSADFVGSAPVSDGSLNCKSGQAIYTR